MKMKFGMRSLGKLLALWLVLCLCCTCCAELLDLLPDMGAWGDDASGSVADVDLSQIPPFTTEPYVIVNDNQPKFEEEDLVTESYEFYSELDSLGRCGMTVACIGRDIMPTEDRDSISSVKPSGWQTFKYDIVDGKYLYNRCHLIGFQLTGENANERNLITGTRYLNIEGMLPFENMVADYVKETGNHVLYRVTPIYDGKNLVAHGVQMEGWSVEDNGEGICFNVYCYNNQPGIVIDYATGNSALSEDGLPTAPEQPDNQTGDTTDPTYILNTNTKKFHDTECGSVQSMSDASRKEYYGERDALIEQGYEPCGSCKP
jgi:DNA-entry nuclease